MAASSKTQERPYGAGDSKWFVEDRFGMFIHWGLYALPARHEWIKHREEIKNEDYQKYFDHFNPDLFNPAEWARAAREAGMKYFVVTTKHHEGFCLFDSKHTVYNSTKTPYGRDIVRMLVDAFRKEGLKVGFYYSLIDWSHPEFPVDCLHPQRNDEEFKKKQKGRDVSKYAEYMRRQVTELLTNYGKIDILWFDFSYPRDDGTGKGRDDWESEKLIRLIRKLQPHVLVNNRLDLPGSGDFETPEQYVPEEGLADKDGKPIVWEGCQTFSGSWGYHRDEQTWKSVPMLIQMLVNHVSRNGNLLLNVGPTARGEFDHRATEALRGIGEWTRRHARSICGCGAAPAGLKAPLDCRYTFNRRENTLYLHIFAWPFKHLHLPGMSGKIEYAQLLNDASEIKFRDASKTVGCMDSQTPPDAATLELPPVKPDAEVPVVEIFLKPGAFPKK